jgi:hypothetical protein
MKNDVFQSLWIGGQLSLVEKVCISSFVKLGLTYHLYTYTCVEGVPNGCQVLDAREILPEASVFSYKRGPGKGSYAAFANVFRYELLSARGGIWVDTDVIALRHPSCDEPIQFAFQDDRLINTAILRFPRGHAAMAYCTERAKNAGALVQWGETGPQLMTAAVTHFRLEAHARPITDFYPIHYREWTKLIRSTCYEEVAARTERSTFLHLWNEMFRRAGFDKTVAPPKESYLGRKMSVLLDEVPQWRYAERRTTTGLRFEKVAAASDASNAT